MSQYTHTSQAIDLSRTGGASPALLDMRVETAAGAVFARLRIDASLPGGHSSASYEMTPQEMRELADALLQAAERVSASAAARAFDRAVDRAYVISTPGVTPYITRAKSSCEAIMSAQARHGVHSVSARPA